MPENIDFDFLITSLNHLNSQQADLLENLAIKLNAFMPDRISIERFGFFFQKHRPIKKMTIQLDNNNLLATKEKYKLCFYKQHIVNQIVLKSEEIDVQEYFRILATQLQSMAAKDQETYRLLTDFTTL